jgi:hypothetical protein
MKSTKTRSNFYLNNSEIEILQKLKIKTGISKSQLIRFAILLIDKTFKKNNSIKLN